MDRSSPPIFIGREEIIERITQDVVRCRSNKDPYRCFTLAIHGAPGAGKSSLLNELELRLGGALTGGKVVEHSLVVVPLSGADLESANFVANAMIEAYTGQNLDFRKEKTGTLTGSAGVLGVSAKQQVSNRERDLREQIQAHGRMWQPVLTNTSVNTAKTVFLLLIDEAQNTPGSLESGLKDKNRIVMGLHEGAKSTSGLKIVPVFAGLPDTETVLATRGASRLTDEGSIQIGSLTQDETKELVSRWMQHDPFGFERLFSDADIEELSKLIAIASERWPRHSNAYLRELAKAILNLEPNGDLTIDINDVLERGHDRRVVYYDARLNTSGLGYYADVISDAAQQSTDGELEVTTLFQIAKEEYEISRSEARALHEKAVHAGVLVGVNRSKRTRFRFPIPSFYTYMQCGEDPVRFKEKMRQQML